MPDNPTGYLGTGRTVRDWSFGGVSGSDLPEVMPEGDWRNECPKGERQNRGFETMSCVSQSFNNCLEIQDRLFGGDVDCSDRALAKASGTTKNGNTFWNVWNAANSEGLCAEETWPFGGFDWTSFYMELPNSVTDEMAESAGKLKYGLEWVDDIGEALKRAPVWAANSGHAFVIVGEKDELTWHVFDSYPGSDGDFMGEMPKSSIMASAIVWSESKHNPMDYPKIANDSLVFENGRGRFGLKVGDRLYVDALDKIISMWAMRSPDFGRKVTVTPDHFDSLAQYTLKNERIN